MRDEKPNKTHFVISGVRAGRQIYLEEKAKQIEKRIAKEKLK
jgi:hypothetical protein